MKFRSSIRDATTGTAHEVTLTSFFIVYDLLCLLFYQSMYLCNYNAEEMLCCSELT